MQASEPRWMINTQFKIIATNKNKIREINILKTILEEELLENQILLILPEKELYFSEINLGTNMFLDNNNSTAFKIGTDDHQMILANNSFKTGRRYFEFSFETEPAERSVILGVCLSRNDYYFSYNDPKGFWGFVPSECKKIGYNEKGVYEKTEFGAACKIGDSFGILMEFCSVSNRINISFFINKINLGVAFKNLPIQNYFPCAVLGLDGSRVQLVPNPLYPDLLL